MCNSDSTPKTGALFAYFAVAMLAIAVVVIPCRATIINVPADQPTIQSGVDIAMDADTVLVAPGYYLENVEYKGKEIVISSHFLLDQDPSFIFSTIIDGSNSARPDTTSTVIIFCDDGSVPVFQGFTVTGGTGTRLWIGCAGPWMSS